MTVQHLGAALALTLTLGACGLDQPAGPGPGPTGEGRDPEQGTPTATRTVGGSPADRPTSTRPTTATEKLLLPEQVRLQQGGDSLFVDCTVGDDTPDGFRDDPGVWLHSLYSGSSYPGKTVLCLRGFDPSGAVSLTVSTGDVQARTTVHPRTGAPTSTSPLGYEDERPETLFVDGAELEVYTQEPGGSPVPGPSGALASRMWQFLPPAAARRALGATGRVSLTATQGALVARAEQEVPVPDQEDYFLLREDGSRDRLVLLGWPAGTTVPVGLYRVRDEQASLVRRVGAVEMPAARVAVLTLPGDLLPGTGSDFCVLPPVEQDAACQYLEDWPPYPGRVLPGDEGPRVRAWQDVLVQAGVISDVPANHDGVYGPATRAAVQRHLDDIGQPDPDGDGVLGRNLYAVLTGVSER